MFRKRQLDKREALRRRAEGEERREASEPASTSSVENKPSGNEGDQPISSVGREYKEPRDGLQLVSPSLGDRVHLTDSGSPVLKGTPSGAAEAGT